MSDKGNFLPAKFGLECLTAQILLKNDIYCIELKAYFALVWLNLLIENISTSYPLLQAFQMNEIGTTAYFIDRVVNIIILVLLVWFKTYFTAALFFDENVALRFHIIPFFKVILFRMNVFLPARPFRIIESELWYWTLESIRNLSVIGDWGMQLWTGGLFLQGIRTILHFISSIVLIGVKYLFWNQALKLVRVEILIFVS